MEIENALQNVSKDLDSNGRKNSMHTYKKGITKTVRNKHYSIRVFFIHQANHPPFSIWN